MLPIHTRRLKRACLLLAFVGLIVSPGLLSAQASDPVTAPSGLRVGDIVRITVWRQPELSGEFEVAEDGTIAHPVYHRVKVTGMPLTSAEDSIRTILQEYDKNPAFVVEPLFQVTVSGDVRQPNLYRVRPQTTVAEAVAMAGGAITGAKLTAVKVFRGGAELTADVTHPNTGVAASPLQSGDQISVPHQADVFRDYIAPGASVAAALGAVLGILLRL